MSLPILRNRKSNFLQYTASKVSYNKTINKQEITEERWKTGGIRYENI